MMMLTGWLPPGWVAAAAPLEAGAVPMALIVAFWLGMELTVTRTVLKAVAVLVVLDGQGLVGLSAGDLPGHGSPLSFFLQMDSPVMMLMMMISTSLSLPPTVRVMVRYSVWLFQTVEGAAVTLTAGIVCVPLMGRMLMVTGCLDASGELLAVSEAVWDSSGREGLSAGTGRTVIVTGALLGAGVLSPWVTVTVSGSWGCC